MGCEGTCILYSSLPLPVPLLSVPDLYEHNFTLCKIACLELDQLICSSSIFIFFSLIGAC